MNKIWASIEFSIFSDYISYDLSSFLEYLSSF